MTDLKIVTIRDLLSVSGVDFLLGMNPPSVQIRGKLFNQAQEVMINNSPAPEFFIISDTVILAQIPSGMEGSVIHQLAVIAESPSKDRSSVLYLDMGKTLRPLRGLERLVQLFCKILLQTPGSDRFNPTIGGGLLSMLGQNSSRTDGQALAASVASAVMRARDQVVSIQNKIIRTPADEKLLYANVEAVGFDPATTTIAARVGIGAASGNQAVTNLTF